MPCTASKARQSRLQLAQLRFLPSELSSVFFDAPSMDPATWQGYTTSSAERAVHRIIVAATLAIQEEVMTRHF